ncbi:MAG: hypothetical protein ACI87A_002071 [Planctomycetota bacterium]|jgi:hypothetical protein
MIIPSNWRIAALAAPALACLSLAPTTSSPTVLNTLENPVELGLVKWGRDFGGAQKAAADSKKPILLLFQEIPG